MVSICIPTYNRSNLLKRAVESAINQTYQDIEILISDNCSTDEHWETVSEIAKLDSRIVLRRNKINIGFAGNLNACIDASKGDYIIFLCDDDELLSTIIEKEVKFFEKYPNVGLIHTDGFDCGLKIRQRKVNYPEILKSGDTALEKIFLEMSIFFSSTMSRKKVFDELGYYTYTSSPDWEMCSRIAKSYDIGFVNEPLVKMYGHLVSTRNPVEYDKEINMLKDRILGYHSDSSKIQKLKAVYYKQIGLMYMDLGYMAFAECKYILGFKYILTAFPYLSPFLFIYRLIIIVVRFPFSSFKIKISSKKAHHTSV